MKRFILLVLIAFSSISLASDSSSGCGPGWYVAKDKSLLSSTLRFITNMVLWPSSTIGMTFGTSGCSKHDLVMKEKERIYFATQNIFELKSEIPIGDGEFLKAFAEVMGCPQQVTEEFNRSMKKNYLKLYPTARPTPSQFLRETFIIMGNNETLRNNCRLV